VGGGRITFSGKEETEFKEREGKVSGKWEISNENGGLKQSHSRGSIFNER